MILYNVFLELNMIYTFLEINHYFIIDFNHSIKYQTFTLEFVIYQKQPIFNDY